MSEVLPAPTIGLARLLNEVGLRADSAIRVTGPGSLSALIWLCRRGYQNVGCLSAFRRAPAERVDAILAAHTASADWLDELLGHGPQVREGGVVLVQTRPDLWAGAAARTFHAHGFDLVRRLPGAHRDVLVARRTCALPAAA